jgi:hypothetical protein
MVFSVDVVVIKRSVGVLKSASLVGNRLEMMVHDHLNRDQGQYLNRCQICYLLTTVLSHELSAGVCSVDAVQHRAVK